LSRDEVFQRSSDSGSAGFPPQPLRGPGLTGLPLQPVRSHPLPTTSRKRQRTASPEPAATGGYGPIPNVGLGGEADRVPAINPGFAAVKFARRKNSAYEIWIFVRAVMTDQYVPPEQWPNDYDQHLVKRPDSPFIGCKLCTQFG